MTASATRGREGRRDRRPRRPRQVVARPRAHGHRPRPVPEEKARGLTIDLGFAFTTLPSGIEVGFVDVPGHVRFVKNMLAGVGAVDVALLVVAANEGWMPQTEEHLRILELLDVRHGVVALTKADLVDAETLELAQLERRPSTSAVTAAELAGRRRRRASAGAASTTCAPPSTRVLAARAAATRSTAGPGSGSTACSPPRARAPSSPARSPAARSRSTTTWWSSRAAARARVRASSRTTSSSTRVGPAPASR